MRGAQGFRSRHGVAQAGWVKPKKGNRLLAHYPEPEEKDMLVSGADKVRNKVDQVTGKVKAAIGRVINDPALEAEGRADQRAAHLRDAGEKVKDAFRPRRRRQMPRRRRQI